MSNKVNTELLSVMAKYQLNRGNLAEKSGIPYSTLLTKINGVHPFTVSEIQRIKSVFVEFGEYINIDKVFFS